MNIRAGLREYILQTHNTKFFLKIQWGGGLNPSNPPPLWVRHWNVHDLDRQRATPSSVEYNIQDSGQ